MATPKRRSARLSGRGTPQRSVKSKKLSGSTLLGDLIEREETPDTKAQPSIDDILATPAADASIQSRFARLSNIKTPTSEPKPTHAQMHPHIVHQTTAKAPDSGLKLGFGDPPSTGGRNSIAVMHNTPSRAPSTPNGAKSNTKSPYEFKFQSASNLSNAAQQLMENLRDEAARIKEQMKAEKAAQDEKDAQAERQFEGFGAAGRKIAKPKGKAGRFSDVHMAAFKKMDSIASRGSAQRPNNAPGFAQPTAQSLKRSPSRAGLDDISRPQTAGKGSPIRRAAPSRLPNRRPASVSPFKNLPKRPQEESASGPAKRQRQSEFGDVSTARFQGSEHAEKSKPSTLPRPISSSGVPHSLLSPTKSSLARSNSTKSIAKPDKPSMISRPQSSQFLPSARPSTGTPFKTTSADDARGFEPSPSKPISMSPSKLPRAESTVLNRPLPPLPSVLVQSSSKSNTSTKRPEATKMSTSPAKNPSLVSRLPTFAGLKSILRPSRPQGLQTQESPPRAATPKRVNTASATDSAKKVDFTPSVKSRYAVKLAAESPSPAKLHQDTPRPATADYDPAAYIMSDNTVDEAEWEDAEEDADVDMGQVAYPTLPTSSPAQKSPSVQTVQAFVQKANGVGRRESLDFKSVVANGIRTVHEHPFSMTAFSTAANKSNVGVAKTKVMKSPGSASKPSPSTIRHVRPSDVNQGTINLFEEQGTYLSHGLPAKKRRHESEKHDPLDSANDKGKENQRIESQHSPAKIPGGWEDSILGETSDDEGVKRGSKRVRVEPDKRGEKRTSIAALPSPVKKTNAARDAAAKAAKDRKKGGILGMSRLNMLARPKGH